MALISVWLRAIRIRFLMASVIAVSNGLAIAYWKHDLFDPVYAAMTYAGVVFLHISVDLLNDYWDHKRGIDSATNRAKFSGGTGVLPDKMLTPRAVYTAGIAFLILGILVGSYFVAIRGVTIALILGFAVVAIYFYSTSIVNAGLGELFVAIKGALIVIGAFYVQVPLMDSAAIHVGVIVGLLSATVLFINSFPDFEADRSKGRRTLVIILGKNRASALFPLFVVAAYSLIAIGIFVDYTKIYSLAALVSLPLAIKAALFLRRDNRTLSGLLPAMGATVTYSRITGFVLAASLFF